MFGTLLFIIFVLTIAGLVLPRWMKAKGDALVREGVESHVNEIPGFKVSRQMVGSDNLTGLAVDEENQKLCLITNRAWLSHRVIAFSDVLSVELVEDGPSLIKTTKSSPMSGIVIGGIGVMTGGTSTSQTVGKVTRLALQLTVNDLSVPLHEILFSHTELERDGPDYRPIHHSARTWLGIVQVAMKRAESSQGTASATTI